MSISEWWPVDRDVRTTYVTQRVRFRRLRAELAPAASTTDPSGFVAREVAYLVSAWNPHGEPTTLEDNIKLDRELRDLTTERDWWQRRVVARDPHNRWVEDGLCLLDITEDDALDLARRFRKQRSLDARRPRGARQRCPRRVPERVDVRPASVPAVPGSPARPR